MSKKASKPAKDEQTYDVGDVVLAKLKGYPSWPAQIVSPDSVPEPVSKAKSKSGKGQSGTLYCVRYFPAGDHSWLSSSSISKLRRHEIESYIAEPHQKREDLMKAYKTALDPQQWEEEQKVLFEGLEEDHDEPEDEVDELEGEDEADGDKKGKKRKRVSTGSTKAKPKAKKEKSPSESVSKKKKSSVEKGDKPAKAKKNGVKSKALVESEDEGERAEDAGPSKKASPPPNKKQKKEKEDVDPELANDPNAAKVRNWRHTLQRAFLGKTVPKDEDMPPLDQLFTDVEDFDMTIKYLQFTKIGKVMRHIATAEPGKVPRDDEFQFKDRAQALVNKWHVTMQSKGDPVNGTSEVAPMETDTAEKPAGDANLNVMTNGDATAPPVTGTTDSEEITMGDIPADQSMLSEVS